MISIHLDYIKQPGVEFRIIKNLKRFTLRLPDELNAICYFLLNSDNDKTVLFVDSQNDSVKRMDLQNGSVDVIYHCDSTLYQRAALFVEFACQQKALLVAEMCPDPATLTMSHSLSVVLFEANRWEYKQRIPLETSTYELDFSETVCIGETYKNKVFCSVSHTPQLEVLSLDSSGAARRLQPLQLGFTHNCFTTGLSEGIELLFVSSDKYEAVRVMAVEEGENLKATLLRFIYVAGNRLLWGSGLLYTTDWNSVSSTHEVIVYSVSRGGQRVERCGKPITHSDNMYIGCWNFVGEKIVLTEGKSQELIVYELKK